MIIIKEKIFRFLLILLAVAYVLGVSALVLWLPPTVEVMATSMETAATPVTPTNVTSVAESKECSEPSFSKQETSDTTSSMSSPSVVSSTPKKQNNLTSIPTVKGSFKSYTNYQLLSKSSVQWKKIQCHPEAHTGEYGLRKVSDYYCVAMGSYYSTTLGDLFKITTEGGTFEVIICDFKADSHTDSTHGYTIANGCVVEFYVDMTCFDRTCQQMGSVSYAEKKFSGNILKIEKIGNYLNGRVVQTG